MFIALDIGNTNIHLGVFEGERLTGHRIVGACHPEELGLDPDILENSQAIVLASVNPLAEEAFCRWLSPRWSSKVLNIPADIPLEMPVLVENPEKVGIDRLLNALAAFKRTHSATLVVDLGTAVTVDAVSDRGEFLGGVIAPGLQPLKQALHTCTALLPEVSLERPGHFLGRNTEQAMNSGLYWGMVGMVERLIKGLMIEMGSRPVVLATGGDAPLLAKDIPAINFTVPHLALEGILTVYNTNPYNKRG